MAEPDASALQGRGFLAHSGISCVQLMEMDMERGSCDGTSPHAEALSAVAVPSADTPAPCDILPVRCLALNPPCSPSYKPKKPHMSNIKPFNSLIQKHFVTKGG